MQTDRVNVWICFDLLSDFFIDVLDLFNIEIYISFAICLHFTCIKIKFIYYKKKLNSSHIPHYNLYRNIYIYVSENLYFLTNLLLN